MKARDWNSKVGNTKDENGVGFYELGNGNEARE